MSCRAALVLLVAVAASSAAQQGPPTNVGCPVSSGLVATVFTGDSTRARRDTNAARPLLKLDARHAIDTTWRFDIAERRWTRPYFGASIGAGWAEGFGGTAASGTTTAPDSARARRWSACAGVSIGMRDPTLVLRGARGVVHLRADVRSFRGHGSAGDSASQRRLP